MYASQVMKLVKTIVTNGAETVKDMMILTTGTREGICSGTWKNDVTMET